MKLTWYGHACFKLESSAGTLVFDPYEAGSVPGLALPPLEADMVISSHMHHDHYAPHTVKLSKKTPSFSVTRIPCFHDAEGGIKRGCNYISVIEAEGLRVAHMGDIGHMLSAEQLEKLGRLDLMIIPVGGFYTVDGPTAAAIVKAAKPRYVIPMHYRGEGFGFDVISTVDDFLGCFEGCTQLDSPVWDSENCPAECGVLLMPCPVAE